MIPSGFGVCRREIIKFAVWACSLRAIPTRKQVQDRFGVSKPTACRWLRDLKDAKGIA